MKNTRVRSAVTIAVLMAASVLNAVGCIGVGTPTTFPNPVPVVHNDIPPALLQELRATYPEAKTFEIQYSAKAGLYGVEIPSGSIELYDAAGNCVGRII